MVTTTDTPHSPVVPAATGLFGTAVALVGQWVTWYVDNIPVTDQILIHIAKVGGVVVSFYSIRILHRNWKTGKNSIDK